MRKLGSNIRDRILAKKEFDSLVDCTMPHLRPILATGYYTGMKKGKIPELTLDVIDFKKRIISIRAEIAKQTRKEVAQYLTALFEILTEEVRILRKTGEARSVFLRANQSKLLPLRQRLLAGRQGLFTIEK